MFLVLDRDIYESYTFETQSPCFKYTLFPVDDITKPPRPLIHRLDTHRFTRRTASTPEADRQEYERPWLNPSSATTDPSQFSKCEYTSTGQSRPWLEDDCVTAVGPARRSSRFWLFAGGGRRTASEYLLTSVVARRQAIRWHRCHE